MIKEQNKALKKFLLLSDMCLVMVSFFIGYFLRNYFMGDENEVATPVNYFIGLLPILLIIWAALLYYFGMYKTIGIRKISEVMLIIFKTAVLGFIIFGSYVFILKLEIDISRLFMGIAFTLAAVLIVVEKMFLIYIFKNISKRGTSFKSILMVVKSVLIIGTGKRAQYFLDLVDNHPDWGIRIVGLVDMDITKKGELVNGHEVLGSFDDIPDIVHSNIVDEVVFIVPRSWLDDIEGIMHFCESEGLNVNLAVNFFELKFSKAKQTDLLGFPLLTFESISHKLGHLIVKRLIDFIVSGIALLLLTPLMLLLAIVVKTTSKGPVYFAQERCGLYGRRFMFYKLRTMVADAESQLDDVLKYNEMAGPVFKMKNDPRVTGIGKFLRKYSLDELPQLWNVLKGDMSLVGPRPPLPSEVENYDSWQRRKLSMRPGITCLWQTMGRSEISDFDEWMKLDLEYIDNWTLWLDIKILFKTLPVVFTGRGAR